MEVTETAFAPANDDNLLSFLSRPESYPEPTKSVDRVESHISWIFLTDDLVYKVKKPVKFDFLDFSTLALREKACEKEVRLNRRLAKDVYLGVVPIFQSGERFSFQAQAVSDSPVEYAVLMRRLPAERMLDARLKRHAVTDDELGGLIERLGEFYEKAKSGERIAKAGRPSSIETNVRANVKSLLERIPNDQEVLSLASAQLQFLALEAQRFEKRIRRSKIRDGHGDLRAEHICLTEPPVVFDCLEFNDRLRHVDVIDDIAFLTMDLDSLGHEETASRIWAALARRLGEEPGDPLLSFYKSYRATVRAKVRAIRAEQVHEDHLRSDPELRRLLALANRYAQAFSRKLMIVTMGLMGTGKSTVAVSLAQKLGAVRLSTDDVRRELIGSGRGAAFNEGIYSVENINAVYDELFARARKCIDAGVSVIIDGSFLKRAHRSTVLELAQRLEAENYFVYCRLPESDAIARLDQRYRNNRSTSDGRPELYEDQRRAFEPPEEIPHEKLIILDTRIEVPQLVEEVLEKLRTKAARGTLAQPQAPKEAGS